MGFTGQPLGPGVWDGHLVCVADGELMLDLTIDQAAEKLPGAVLQPVWGPAPAGFARGGQIRTRVGNCDVLYEAVPDTRDFLDQPDWHDELERRHVLDAILGELEDAQS